MVEVVEIVLEVVHRHSNEEVAAPSFSEWIVATETLEPASVVTGVAFQVAEEDALPLTSAVEEVEEYSPEENHWTAGVGQEEVEGDP